MKLLLSALLSSAASIVFVSPAPNPQGSQCSFNMKSIPENHAPLFLHIGESGSLEPLRPKVDGRNGVIEVKEKDKIRLSCPGKNNYLRVTKTPLAEVTCLAGSLSIGGSKYNADVLGCDSRAMGTTTLTKTPCGKGKGQIIELGFNVGNDWIPLIKLCHDVEKSNTFYSVHTLQGAILAAKVKRPDGKRPSFCRGDKELFKGFIPEKVYTKENQLDVLSKDLGQTIAKEMTCPKDHYMAKGHLAPDADFVFVPQQYLTYFFVNAAPQWQCINACNWKRVEEETRSKAKSVGADFEIVTGTLGILELTGEKNVQKEIRLIDGRVAAPEFFWKVVRNTKDDSCIAFISSNNPFIKDKPRIVCKDICTQAGWPFSDKHCPKGYVYCCKYDDLKNAVPGMPDLTCKSVLTRK